MTADPGGRPVGRDVLGQGCFALHIAIMLYIVGGWAVPARGALIFYLLFVPAVALHWLFNRNACILNNLESVMRTGRWRDPTNREEGAWLLTLVKDATGIVLTPGQMDAVSYVVMALLWGAALWHLRGW
ncbi:MAG: hypothetical protein KGJ78_14975 [Alphaproteobacteria bacterium]|nr:hypothetical protein [Alphaproteobacteria bacterium]